MSEEFTGFEVQARLLGENIRIPFGLFQAGTNQLIMSGYTVFINTGIIGSFYIKFLAETVLDDRLIFLVTPETIGFSSPQPGGRARIEALYDVVRPDELEEYGTVGQVPPDAPPEVVPRPIIEVEESAAVSSENKGVADIWATINDNLVTFFSSQESRGLGDIADPLGIGGLLGVDILGMIAPAFDTLVSKQMGTNLDAISGATDPGSPLSEGLGGIFAPFAESYIRQLDALTDVEELGDSALTPESAAAKAKMLTGAMAVLNLGLWVAHTVAEVASLGQVEAVSELKDMVLDPMGLSSISQQTVIIPVTELLLKPLQQYYAAEFTPEIPDVAELINIQVKDKFDPGDFERFLAFKGLSEYWAGKIWDAHYIAPDYGNLIKAFYRTDMSQERLTELLKLVDLDPDYNDEIWFPNIGEIPPVSELVNQRVKEVITQGELEASLKFWGYQQEWAGRIWDAHFMAPSLNDILVAYRRQIPVTIPEINESTGQVEARQVERLTIEDVHQLMILVDLDPRYQSIFDTRIYDDPSVTMGRFMFETGAIDEARVVDIVRRDGFHPNDIPFIANYIIGFQERLWRRRYIVQVQRAYERGVRTEAELRAEVRAAHYTKGVADWMLATSDLRLEMRGAATAVEKPKIISLGDMKKLYQLNKIDSDNYRQRLLLRGYELADIDLLIDLEDSKKVFDEAGGKKIALSQSELLNAWRFDQVTEDYLRTELMLRGLSLSELDILVATKKRQWGIE